MMRALILTAGLTLGVAASVPPALRCPDVADAFTATGWQEYRAGRIERAEHAFGSALARCPDHVEARVGLGYAALRLGEPARAEPLFEAALRAEPDHIDALAGRGLAAWRNNRPEAARAAFDRVLELDPARDDVREYLSRVPQPEPPPPPRPPLVVPDTLELRARARGDGFEVRTADGWKAFHVNGVNLGAALPGRFPSEFPDAATYRTWLEGMAEMGANTVRVYTMHPPAFYDALAAHNAANPDRALWLLHGVWAELPPGDDYRDPAWLGAFHTDIERVIDILHGRADIEPRPGRAGGHYTADVSRWTLGLILGREWEPYSVAGFNERHGPGSWRGRYLRIEDAPAMDVWLAEAMEHAVAYETRRYRTQRPVSYTNWPTLDPMTHPVEMDAYDELAIRGVEADRTKRAHNEDEVSLGAVPIHATAEFPAGWFAAFHAYPYYPDFFLHDPVYRSATSPWGPSSYFGYLTDLKSRFRGVPVVIAEYGVPVSWGIAHFNPQGWHHGGHGEAAQAAINARLTREIAAAGMAGGVLFAWIDEWFKHTWLDAPQERPSERNRMWWNRMSPEQHYGVLALEPEPRLGGTLEDRRSAWDTVPPLYRTADGTTLRAHADEAYLWLHVSGPAVRADRVMVGFDVVDPASGALRLPGARGPAVPVGLEYILELADGQARVRAAPGVWPFDVLTLPRGATVRDVVSPVENAPATLFAGSLTQAPGQARPPRATSDGRFESLLAVIHRARVGADSTNYLGLGYDRGVLPAGPLPDGAWERVPGADAIEVRLPWTLIGVTDPSGRHVAYGGADNVVTVDSIRLVLAARTGDDWTVWPRTGRVPDVASFTWPTWEEPRFRARRRPVFEAVGSVWRELARDHAPVVTTVVNP